MHHLLAVVGPTGSGKTKLAVKLAKKFNGVIISADSRQVYRGLDIGTNKEGVPGKWGNYQFIIDDALKECDFWISDPSRALASSRRSCTDTLTPLVR